MTHGLELTRQLTWLSSPGEQVNYFMRAAGTLRRRGGEESASPTQSPPSEDSPLLSNQAYNSPLNPEPWSADDWQLWFNRLGRVGLAGVVPFILIVGTLPRSLFLVTSGDLCLRRVLYHPRGLVVPCAGGEEPTFLQQIQEHWFIFSFTAWVSVQFLYNFAEVLVPIIRPADISVEHYDNYACYKPRWCSRCKLWKPPRCCCGSSSRRLADAN